MKPVYQTKFGSEGNCLVACLASIFEIGIKDVPDVEPSNKPGLQIPWHKKLNDWLKRDFGLTYIEVREIDWIWRIKIGYHIISGTSPRDLNLYHAIVGCCGEQMHDPFSKDGPGVLDDVNKRYGLFVKHF